ncbi:MAG: hypothetical protein ACOC8C_00360 [Chloroflexota bacterium]
MAVYGTETEKDPQEVISLAKDTFGEDGLGLSLAAESGCCVRFEGGGGHIEVSVVEEGTGREVILETREWDYHVRRFLNKI